MIRRGLGAVLAATALLGIGMPSAGPYPVAARGTVVDQYFGVAVPDPYRSLESKNDSATISWRDQEAALSRKYLDDLPGRASIELSLHKLRALPQHVARFRKGRYWFVTRQIVGDNRTELEVCAHKAGSCRLLIDPRKLERDGRTEVIGFAYSASGNYVAYGTAVAGTDSQRWRVRYVPTGRDLPDIVRGGKYWAPTWDADKGFYWEGYRQRANVDTGPYSIFFHSLRTDAQNDRLVYAPPKGRPWFSAIELTGDRAYALVSAGTSAGNGMFWRRYDAPDSALRPLFPVGTWSYGVFANDGPIFYVLTTAHAANGRIAWTDIRDPRHQLHDILRAQHATITEVVFLRHRFYVNEVVDVHSVIRIVDRAGRDFGTIRLPGDGEAFFGASDRHDRELQFGYTSFLEPGLYMAYDTRTHNVRIIDKTPVPFDRREVETEQFFAISADGTRVPYFVTHRKDIPYDGSTPTILYGYGGFGQRLLPEFSWESAIWVPGGGAFAVANVRGGGEYGDAWHLAATRRKKQHSFDDFFAVAKALVARRITSPQHLGIYGASGGGLLVGAAEVQHPEFYGAVVAESGLYDMLRYQYYGKERTWETEDGASDESAADFRALAAYSPYHNIRDGARYPATLVYAESEDDRVDPAHSYKFAAALQHAQSSPAPILLDVLVGGGHADGRQKYVDRRLTDILSFMGSALGHHWH